MVDYTKTQIIPGQMLKTNVDYVNVTLFVTRAVMDFGSGSGRNLALFPNPAENPAPAKIPPEPDSFAGFEVNFWNVECQII